MFNTLFLLFITFFKIGLFTIGGGYAMIPLITEEVVNQGWCTQLEVLDYIAVSESTPGPFSINTATFIGVNQAGIPGIIAAVLGLITPSFVIILIIAKFFTKFLEYKGVRAAMTGLTPAAIGLMTAAAVSIAMTAFNMNFINYGTKIFTEFHGFAKNINFLEIAVFIIVATLAKLLKLNSYKIIIVSAAFGILIYTANDFIGLSL